MDGLPETQADGDRASRVLAILRERLRTWSHSNTGPAVNAGRELWASLWLDLDEDAVDVLVARHYPGSVEEYRRRVVALSDACFKTPRWLLDAPLRLGVQPEVELQFKLILGHTLHLRKYLHALCRDAEVQAPADSSLSSGVQGQAECEAGDLAEMVRSSLSHHEQVVLGAVIMRLRSEHLRMTRDGLGMYLADVARGQNRLSEKSVRKARKALEARGLLELDSGGRVLPTPLGLRAYAPTDSL